MATGAGLRRLEEPVSNFRYCVEIDGVRANGFSVVSGMSAETDVIEYREGCDASTPRKFRGQTKYADLTLSRAITSDLDLWNLQGRVFDAFAGASGVSNPLYKFDMYLIQRDMAGLDIRTWKFERCWVSKYEIGDLSGDGSEVALETVQVTHEGFYIES